MSEINASHIKVTNQNSSSIKVAISKWGREGNTSYFTIQKGKNETWSRSDSKGFIMRLNDAGNLDGPYYVDATATVVVNTSNVSGATYIDRD